MNIKDVENLAELAKLELTSEEKENLLKDFDSILAYVRQIEEVEVPTKVGAPGVGTHNVWREDQEEVKEFSHEEIIKQFPNQQDGFLKVKKIL